MVASATYIERKLSLPSLLRTSCCSVWAFGRLRVGALVTIENGFGARGTERIFF